MIRFLRFFGLALVGIFSAACGTALTPLSRSPQLVQDPPIGEVRTAQLGDTLLTTSKLTKYSAIRLTEAVNQTTGWLVTAQLKMQGTFVERYKLKDDTCYAPVEQATIDAQRIDALICITPSGQARVINANDPEQEYKIAKPPQYERMTYVDPTAPAFEQELVYNGRAESILKFLYREFVTGTARPAFTQDVQYDLNEGNVIGFKSARLQVIEATNTSITYKVLAHFPPPAAM
jgi:hypothetical protein